MGIIVVLFALKFQVHMLRSVLIGLFIMFCAPAIAQDADSIFVAHKSATWSIRYTVKAGESMQMLAKRFYISEALLTYANESEGAKKITTGDMINIPLTKDNFFTVKQPLDTHQPLYYHVGPKDNIGLIATYSGVTKDEMRVWNNLHGYTLTEGQVMFIGWVKMVDRDTSNPGKMAAYPAPPKPVKAGDTMKVTVLGGMDTIYNRQTNNGISVLTEKGTAVFFDKAGKNNIFYAFHNATPRGTIIKITNPGTGRTIYAKVLDKVPDTKQYNNSIIGISSFAKDALGVVDNKAWVEISYPAN